MTTTKYLASKEDVSNVIKVVYPKDNMARSIILANIIAGGDWSYCDNEGEVTIVKDKDSNKYMVTVKEY